LKIKFSKEFFQTVVRNKLDKKHSIFINKEIKIRNNRNLKNANFQTKTTG